MPHTLPPVMTAETVKVLRMRRFLQSVADALDTGLGFDDPNALRVACEIERIAIRQFLAQEGQ